MKSIQTRLNLGFISLTLVVFVVLWLAVGWFLRQTAYEFSSDRLASDAFAILRAVDVEPGQTGWQLTPELIPPLYQQPMSGHYFQISVNNKWRYSRSLWDDKIPTDSKGMKIGHEMTKLIKKDKTRWLVRESHFMKQGQPVMLLVARDVGPFEKGMAKLGWLVAGLGVIFLAGLLVVQVLVIQSGLRSLVRVRQDIGDLKEGRIRQLPQSDTAEVEPLVTEVNYLVQSMELRLQRSRNALGNFAHAAKTPLTVLDRQIESLSESEPDKAEAMKEQSTRLCGLMTRELTRARIAGGAMPGQRILISEEVVKLQRTLKMIYRDKALDIESDIAQGSIFPGERDDLVELLGNLLDNACKWANETVSVSTQYCCDMMHIVIEDDGPGIAEEQIERIMSRGERIDESRSGHGLGMSIVMDIVRQYQGNIKLDRSERLGGLRIGLCLPRHCDAKVENPLPADDDSMLAHPVAVS